MANDKACAPEPIGKVHQPPTICKGGCDRGPVVGVVGSQGVWAKASVDVDDSRLCTPLYYLPQLLHSYCGAGGDHVGGRSSFKGENCQHAGANRWAVASVEIAQAAGPKKTIPISPRKGEVPEKAGSGSRGDGLSGPGEDRSEPQREELCWKGSVGGQWVYTHECRRAKKLIPGKGLAPSR